MKQGQRGRRETRGRGETRTERQIKNKDREVKEKQGKRGKGEEGYLEVDEKQEQRGRRETRVERQKRNMSR